jgi:hypothetical protein
MHINYLATIWFYLAHYQQHIFCRIFMNLALETLDTYLFHYDFTSELAKALSFCVYRTTRHFESNYEGLANQYTSSDRKK